MRPRAASRRPKRPTLVFLMVAFPTVLLVISTVLTVLAYQLALEHNYVQSLHRKLLQLMDQIEAAEFDPEFLSVLDTDVRIFVVDAQSGEICYLDRYFHGEALPNMLTVSSPAEMEASLSDTQTDALLRYNYYTAKQLIQAVDAALGGKKSGSFFSSENWAKTDDSVPFSGRALYLNGVHNGRYFSLSLAMESLHSSLQLAIRYCLVISLSVWLLGMLLIAVFWNALTKTTTAIVKTADQLSNLDFSSRCPPALTAEFADLAASVNSLSDQLESYIAQLKQTNEQLNREYKQSERQRKLMQELFANLSHDLKTPIAIISGYAEGLTEGVARTEAQRMRYLNMILRESENMQAIVSKMLAIGRLESGALPLQMTDFDLSEMVRDVISSFQLEITKAGLDDTYEIAPAIMVHSDRECILQVVTNYVQNAVFHIHAGKRLRVILEQDGSEAVFRVANSSLPIVGEDAKSIWDKLYRGNHARSRDRGEAGLGLCIVKGNMERLGQRYGFVNLEDEGMVEFYFRLPLSAAVTPARSALDPAVSR